MTAFSAGRYSVALLDLADGRRVGSVESHVDFGAKGQGTEAVGVSADGGWALAIDSALARKDDRHTLSLWQLDWELEAPDAADWDEAARPHLEAFLARHTPCAQALPVDGDPTPDEVTMALTRRGEPVWSEADFESLRCALGAAGLGRLRPDGVRRRLEEMKAATMRSWRSRTYPSPTA